MRVLRRISTLVPQPIQTGDAPRIAVGTDVATVPPRPVVMSAVRDDSDGRGPLSGSAASPHLASVPPTYQPGTCYHHGHIEHEGERLGVLVLNDRDASLLRCGHVNPDGR